MSSSRMFEWAGGPKDCAQIQDGISGQGFEEGMRVCNMRRSGLTALKNW